MTFFYCWVNMVTSYFTDVEYEAERLSELLKAIKKFCIGAQIRREELLTLDAMQRYLSVKIGL